MICPVENSFIFLVMQVEIREHIYKVREFFHMTAVPEQVSPLEDFLSSVLLSYVKSSGHYDKPQIFPAGAQSLKPDTCLNPLPTPHKARA